MVNTPLDILSINETKIYDSVPDNEISITGYHLIRKDRNRHGGGCLCISVSLYHSLEMICVEISRLHSRSLLVNSWYRPPNSESCLFDEYEIFLQKFDLENKE
jgi:hypothetical protein